MSQPVESTARDKAVVAFTAFACSCLGFVLAAVLMVPIVGSTLLWIGVPDSLTKLAVAFTLFAPPIVTACLGISIGERLVGRPSEPTATA